MGLSEIAAGVEVTAEQHDRGVATVDATETSLADRLQPHADALPCSPAAAATVVERYAAGASVGASARAAGLAPTTAAKTLHLLGERVDPLGPTGRAVLDDWLAARLTRTETLELLGVSEAEFALAVYVATHDPIEAAATAVADALAPDGDAAVDKRDHLSDAIGSPPDRH